MLACSACACAAGVAAAAPAAGVAAEAAGEVAEAGAVEDLEPKSGTKCNKWPAMASRFCAIVFFWGGLSLLDLQRRHPCQRMYCRSSELK